MGQFSPEISGHISTEINKHGQHTIRVHDISGVELPFECSHEIKLNWIFVPRHLLDVKRTNAVLGAERPSVFSRKVVENPVYFALRRRLARHSCPRSVVEHDIVMQVSISEMADHNDFSGRKPPPDCVSGGA